MALLTELLCLHECSYLFFDSLLRVSACSSSLRATLTFIQAIHVHKDSINGLFRIPPGISLPVNLFMHIDGPIDTGFAFYAGQVANAAGSWHRSIITIVADSIVLRHPYTEVCDSVDRFRRLCEPTSQLREATCAIHFVFVINDYGPVDIDDLIPLACFLAFVGRRCFSPLFAPDLSISVGGHRMVYSDVVHLIRRLAW